MKRTLIISIVSLVVCSPASAYYGRGGDDLRGLAEVIRASGGAIGGVITVTQNGRNYKMAEKEQEFRHQQTASVPYDQVPNTAQGQRIAQIRQGQEIQALEQENAELRQALSDSLTRENSLVQRISQLQQKNTELQAKVAELEAAVKQILKQLPAASATNATNTTN